MSDEDKQNSALLKLHTAVEAELRLLARKEAVTSPDRSSRAVAHYLADRKIISDDQKDELLEFLREAKDVASGTRTAENAQSLFAVGARILRELEAILQNR